MWTASLGAGREPMCTIWGSLRTGWRNTDLDFGHFEDLNKVMEATFKTILTYCKESFCLRWLCKVSQEAIYRTAMEIEYALLTYKISLFVQEFNGSLAPTFVLLPAFLQ